MTFFGKHNTKLRLTRIDMGYPISKDIRLLDLICLSVFIMTLIKKLQCLGPSYGTGVNFVSMVRSPSLLTNGTHRPT